MLLHLLACWQPAPFEPPPAAQVEASDVLEGTAGEIEPGAPEGVPDAAEASGDVDGAAADADEAPGSDVEPEVVIASSDKEVEPYAGQTVGRPLTLVGDDGAVVLVITDEGTAVTVLMEGPERVKVRCDGCRPPVEGWLQRRAVVVR